MYISLMKITVFFFTAINLICILQCRVLKNRSSSRDESPSTTDSFTRRSEIMYDHNSTSNTEHILLDGKPFTPFYVPDGSQVIYAKDRSESIKLTGMGWKESLEGHGTGIETSVRGDWLEITWSGQDLQYYGFKAGSKERGVRQIGIYLDGKLQRSEEILDCHLGESYVNQLIYGVEYLPSTQHTLKIVHEGEEGELLSAFAFVTTDRQEASPSVSQIDSKTKTQRSKRTSESVIEKWSLVQKGHTGVAAMQMSVISDQEVIIIDRVEHNPLTTKGHPAWAAIYNLKTHQLRALNPLSNSFCAAGSFLGNGTLINLGGNPARSNGAGYLNFENTDGRQSIRLFTPCEHGNCDLHEYPHHLSLASARWYPTVTRLADGSVMIVGGSISGAWRNSASINNPTIEYFPPKTLAFAHDSPKVPIHLPFLDRTLPSNLYPIVITLPMVDMIFMAANNDAILYNWRKGIETRLPSIPNGVRVTYPFTGSGILLPLSYRNHYEPEVLICGGSATSDHTAVQNLKVSDPASSQCVRMLLTTAGIKKGWQVEKMPSPRILPDSIIMPDGKVLIVNGAKSGAAGYGNFKDKVGQSDADHPAFTPVLYDPDAPPGKRFTTDGLPTSTIPRLYHSTASLTPCGEVMIAGSNPNDDRSTTKYPTEYRVEWLRPPYIGHRHRPVIISLPSRANFDQSFDIKIKTPGIRALSRPNIKVVLMDLGFVTHSVHMNSRWVELRLNPKQDSLLDLGELRLKPSLEEPSVLSVKMPHCGEVYPPGFGWIFVIVDGIPSEGRRIMVGTGKL